jgi:hypothetical protein
MLILMLVSFWPLPAAAAIVFAAGVLEKRQRPLTVPDHRGYQVPSAAVEVLSEGGAHGPPRALHRRDG